jgi:hypothetical protein
LFEKVSDLALAHLHLAEDHDDGIMFFGHGQFMLGSNPCFFTDNPKMESWYLTQSTSCELGLWRGIGLEERIVAEEPFSMRSLAPSTWRDVKILPQHLPQ